MEGGKKTVKKISSQIILLNHLEKLESHFFNLGFIVKKVFRTDTCSTLIFSRTVPQYTLLRLFFRAIYVHYAQYRL